MKLTRLSNTIHVHHWVLWWFYVGIVCGIVVMINILFRHLTPIQEKLALILGAVHWGLGGVVCYYWDGIQFHPPSPHQQRAAKPEAQSEWHSASDFVLPGGRKSILPPKY